MTNAWIHHDPRTDRWAVACTDHGLLWYCSGEREAQGLAWHHDAPHDSSNA